MFNWAGIKKKFMDFESCIKQRKIGDMTGKGVGCGGGLVNKYKFVSEYLNITVTIRPSAKWVYLHWSAKSKKIDLSQRRTGKITAIHKIIERFSYQFQHP